MSDKSGTHMLDPISVDMRIEKTIDAVRVCDAPVVAYVVRETVYDSYGDKIDGAGKSVCGIGFESDFRETVEAVRHGKSEAFHTPTFGRIDACDALCSTHPLVLSRRHLHEYLSGELYLSFGCDYASDLYQATNGFTEGVEDTVSTDLNGDSPCVLVFLAHNYDHGIDDILVDINVHVIHASDVDAEDME